MSSDPATAPALRMGVFAMMLIALGNLSNFYVYDSIGPLAAMLESELGYSDTQIGTLNAIYSVPNVLLVLFGGMLVDRYGVGRMATITAAIWFGGALLTSLSPDFYLMASGRLLFGIGAETFNICTLAAAALWFPLRHTALAIGATLAMGRVGSVAVDLSPTWAAGAYASGWQQPLFIAAGVALLGFVATAAYWWLEHRCRVDRIERTLPAAKRLALADVLAFGSPYWYLLALCVFWYAAILAFRSTFAIKYFQHVHGLSLAEAGQYVSYVFLAAIVSTPLLGWLCDRTGRYAALLAFGALLLPCSFAVLDFALGDARIGTVLLGISYSLVPAAMWPLLSRLVEARRFGTALGLMWMIQNLGIASANFAAGALNDIGDAGAHNAAGYQPMMLFFLGMSVLGAVFALLLWRSSAGRLGAQSTDEAAAHH